VKIDPRLKVTMADLREQLELGRRLAANMSATYEGYNQAAQVLADLTDRAAKAANVPAVQAALDKAKGVTDAVGGLGPMNRDLTRLLIAVDQADTAPAAALLETYAGMCLETKEALDHWDEVRTKELPQANAALVQAKLTPVSVPAAALTVLDCGK
jgi:hypothetical protein